MRTQLVSLAVACAALIFAGQSSAADDAAAQSLMKKSACGNCHSLDKVKSGPSYKDISAKYKGKDGAEAALVQHLMTNPKVKVDGKEEAHPSLKTKNEADVKNVAQWVLSR